MQVFKFPAVVEMAILEQRDADLASRSSLPFDCMSCFLTPVDYQALTFRFLATDIPSHTPSP